MLLSLIQAGVAVYSPHTAFDNAKDGINDSLAGRLDWPMCPVCAAGWAARSARLSFSCLMPTWPAFPMPCSRPARQHRAIQPVQLPPRGHRHLLRLRRGQPDRRPKRPPRKVSEWRLEVVCPESAVTPSLRPCARPIPTKSRLTTFIPCGRILLLRRRSHRPPAPPAAAGRFCPPRQGTTSARIWSRRSATPRGPSNGWRSSAVPAVSY